MFGFGQYCEVSWGGGIHYTPALAEESVPPPTRTQNQSYKYFIKKGCCMGAKQCANSTTFV